MLRLTLLGLTGIVLTASVEADSILFFRSDSGHARNTSSVPQSLNLEDNLIWKTPLPPGHSTPVVSDHRIFLTTFDPESKELATMALNRRSGKIIWKAVAPAERIEPFHQIGSAAMATPVFDGQRVCVFFGSYGLLCYDVDGKEIWKRPMGPFQDEFGAGSSPVLKGKLLLLNQDHDANNFLYAFDMETGKELWKVPRNEFTRSYSTPLVIEHDGQTQILVAGSLRLTSYDTKGNPLWWVDGLARIVNPIPTYDGKTVYMATWAPGGDAGQRIAMESFEDAAKKFDKNHNGKIELDELDGGPVVARFYRIDVNQDNGLDVAEWQRHATVFEKAQNAILAIDPNGQGNITKTHIKWKYSRGIPYVATPVIHHDTIFMVKDGGILTSIDKHHGEVRKQGRLPGRGNYYSSPVQAAGTIYIASERGVLSSVAANPEWSVESKIDFGESIYATPVIVDNRIYIRTENALYCFGRSE